jgi:hypothetical protein
MPQNPQGFHGDEDSSRGLHPEDGNSMVLRNFGILPKRYTTHNPEDLDLNLHPEDVGSMDL